MNTSAVFSYFLFGKNSSKMSSYNSFFVNSFLDPNFCKFKLKSAENPSTELTNKFEGNQYDQSDSLSALLSYFEPVTFSDLFYQLKLYYILGDISSVKFLFNEIIKSLLKK